MLYNRAEEGGDGLQIDSRPSFVKEDKKDDADTNVVVPDFSDSDNSTGDSKKEVSQFSQEQQNVYQIYFPCQTYSGQTLQVPVSVDSQFVPFYQQVPATPAPQPVNRLTPQTFQCGRPFRIEQSSQVAPYEYGVQRYISAIPTTDWQQCPYQEVSSSDTRSVSSVSSLYPSGMSTPAFPGAYHDNNSGNQPMLSPLSTQSLASSQVITQNLVPFPDMPHFYPANPQGHLIPNNTNRDNQVTKMTVPSSTLKQPQPKLETASASTQINITPLQKTITKTRVSITTKGRKDAIYNKSFSYIEEQHEKHSNLYVTWPGQATQLRHKLELKNLEVHSIQSTAIKDLWNIVFDSHSSARKAFTTQREIKIRMVPPRGSKKNWLRNPSPNFLVQYETKCRLDVRWGKSVVHDLVGTLLMTKSSPQEYIGCHIWADQLKGHRIRIVGCVGKFMFPCKRIINMIDVPPKHVGNDPIGWVSYKNRTTREELVTRISGNLFEEYIYNGSTDLQCP